MMKQNDPNQIKHGGEKEKIDIASKDALSTY
jgi:hypothetical protein